MSAHDELPRDRELRVRVTKHSAELDFFSALHPAKRYTTKIGLEQFAELVALVAAADGGQGPREFFLGFTPERLAFHQLAAEPWPRLPSRRHSESGDSSPQHCTGLEAGATEAAR